MQSYKRLEHPVIQVSIGGSPVDIRPSSFHLITDKGFPSVHACLRFPAESGIGASADPVVVNLYYGDEEHLLFTGEIFDAADHGAYRELSLTDGYKKLCDTEIVAAYRKEMAGVILQDTLDAAGITETNITCPEVEFDRFSTDKIKADKIIICIIHTLQTHGHEGVRFFFDEKNIFHFGKIEDSGKNTEKVFELETGKDIFKKGQSRLDILPLPIRQLQEVIIDGETLRTFRTDLHISGQRSLLRIWVEAL